MGFIVEFDSKKKKKTMNQCHNGIKMGLNPGILAMNLAVKQLKQNDF